MFQKAAQPTTNSYNNPHSEQLSELCVSPSAMASAFQQYAGSVAAIGDCIRRLQVAAKTDDLRQRFLSCHNVREWLAEESWLKKLDPTSLHLAKCMGSNFVGPAFYARMWGEIPVEEAPRFPAGLNGDLIKSECKITGPGSRVKDTHLLVFVPKTIEGQPVSIHKLCARLGIDFDPREAHASLTEQASASKWLLIPKDPSLNQAFGNIPVGYRPLNGVELFTAMLFAEPVPGAFPAGGRYRCEPNPATGGEDLVISSFRDLSGTELFSSCHRSDARLPYAICVDLK